MPLFTGAGSASHLVSKTARVCFHQLSFPTFSNAEVLLILFVLSFQLVGDVLGLDREAHAPTARRWRLRLDRLD